MKVTTYTITESSIEVLFCLTFVDNLLVSIFDRDKSVTNLSTIGIELGQEISAIEKKIKLISESWKLDIEIVKQLEWENT